MIFVLDNYDSFTYNLVQYLGELGAVPMVRRNNQVTLDEIAAMAPTHIVISPGPGRPEDAGITLDRHSALRPERADPRRLPRPSGHRPGLRRSRDAGRPCRMHGKTSMVEHDGKGVFAGLAGRFQAARYHSLVVADEGLPDSLEVSARTQRDGLIMGLRHREHPVHGVQFHPESVLTEEGRQLLRNFLNLPGRAE